MMYCGTKSGSLDLMCKQIDEKEEALFQSRVPPKLYDILSKKPGDGISFQEYLMLFR